MSRVIDSHVHLELLKQTDRVQHPIRVMLQSVIPDDNRTIASLTTEQLCNENIDILAKGFGLHPHYSYLFNDQLYDDISQYLAAVPNSMVGEIGLEQRTGYLAQNPMPQQIECFRRLLALSFSSERPASIHLVARRVANYDSSFQIFIQVLRECKARYKTEPLLILHSYSGSYETLKQICAIHQNTLIGVGHLNYKTKHIQRIAQDAILKKYIIFETDFWCSENQAYDSLLGVAQDVEVCQDTAAALLQYFQ